MATTVRQMLTHKPAVYAVAPDTTVFNALRMMAERNIGAVVVLDGDRLAGIFSERDYARKVALVGRASKDTPVRDIMTPDVVCIDPAWTADECMALMTERRIRHLPVLVDRQVTGVISIGDVVRAVVDEQQMTIRELTHYIASGA
jgi:CBS domain-containing protein